VSQSSFKKHNAVNECDSLHAVEQSIVVKVHAAGGRFMKQNWREVWVELSEKERRRKVNR